MTVVLLNDVPFCSFVFVLPGGVTLVPRRRHHYHWSTKKGAARAPTRKRERELNNGKQKVHKRGHH